MCQAKVFLLEDGQEKEIMKDVVEIEVKDEEIVLKSFFAEPKTIKGKIITIDFLKSKVIIEPKGGSQNERKETKTSKATSCMG